MGEAWPTGAAEHVTTARGDTAPMDTSTLYICQRPAPFTPRGADVYKAAACLLMSLGEGGSRGDGQGVAARSRRARPSAAAYGVLCLSLHSGPWAAGILNT